MMIPGEAEQSADDAHTLLLPFIVCTEQGGPYPNDAFSAGFECGQIYAELSQCEAIKAIPRARWLVAGIFPQVDLIAMRFGYTVTAAEHDATGTYIRAVFTHPDLRECVH